MIGKGVETTGSGGWASLRKNWIKCSDRLPILEDYDELLTFQIMKHIRNKKPIPHISLDITDTLYIEDGKLYVDGTDEEITHWLPLPKAPND